MPRYRVLKPGFYNSVYYHPNKRQYLNTDEKFKKVPSWLELVKEPSAAAKKAAAKKEKEELQAAAEKAAEDKIAIDEVSNPEGPKSTVEIL